MKKYSLLLKIIYSCLIYLSSVQFSFAQLNHLAGNYILNPWWNEQKLFASQKVLSQTVIQKGGSTKADSAVKTEKIYFTASGNVEKFCEFDKNGREILTNHFYYDAKGKITKETRFDHGDSLVFEYHWKKNELQSITLEGETNEGVFFTWDKGKLFHLESSFHNTPEEQKESVKEWEVMFFANLTWNDKRQVVSLNAGDPDPHIHYDFFYDEKGRLIKELFYIYVDKLVHDSDITYNEKNLPILSTVKIEGIKDPDKRTFQFEYRYEFR